MEVSIIIVNFNTLEFTKNCINSVVKNTIGVNYEIIIVDNASTDGSVEYFQQQDEIKLIVSKTNLGFGAGNNLGAKFAKGKYLFFLNPDTIFLNNALKYFIDYFEDSKNKLGVLGGFLLDTNEDIGMSNADFKSIRNHIKFCLKILAKKSFKFKCEPGPLNYKVDAVLGADIFMQRKLFDEINGFDSDFFLYVEEVEMQKRIADLGYDRILIKGPRIVHFEGGSNNKNGGKLKYSTIFRLQEGNLRYVYKHHSRLYYIVYLLLQFFTWLPWVLADKRFTSDQRIQLFRLLFKRF